MSYLHEAKTRSEHKPTLDRDGFEVIIRPLGERPRVRDGLEVVRIGPTMMSDAKLMTRLHEFLVVDPERSDLIEATVFNARRRETLLTSLAEGGYRQFTSEFDSHVIAVRTKPYAPKPPNAS